jgi:NAD(P)H-hydrate repair Nnr-like enzyme with NAD(P)H-hydrate dehydratase domain
LADSRLATQGSGDVLTGLIAGLIQRIKPSSHRNIAALCMAVMIQKYSLRKAFGLPVMVARDQLRVFPMIAQKWLQRWSES